MAAMTAARPGEGSLAIDLLLMDAVKNTYLPNGHNCQRDDLLADLPGNGGLLAAVAMMACGWLGGPRSMLRVSPTTARGRCAGRLAAAVKPEQASAIAADGFLTRLRLFAVGGGDRASGAVSRPFRLAALGAQFP